MQVNQISNSIKRVLLAGGLLTSIFLTGCALTPTVADINIPSVANPTSGPAVKIVSVEDRREFGPFVSGKCDQPSVEGDYHDKALTSRVFGRKGCKFERANILLPEGQTIAGQTQVVVANAFKEAGYRVISGDISEQVMSVSVVVIESWLSRDLDGMGVRFNSNQRAQISLPNSPLLIVEDKTTDKIYGELGEGAKFDFYTDSILNFQHKLADQIKASQLNAQRVSNP